MSLGRYFQLNDKAAKTQLAPNVLQEINEAVTSSFKFAAKRGGKAASKEIKYNIIMYFTPET